MATELIKRRSRRHSVLTAQPVTQSHVEEPRKTAKGEKVTLLSHWTSECVSSQHLLPDVAARRHPEPLSMGKVLTCL